MATDDGAVRWLDDDEIDAWLGVVAFMVRLPSALDAQLESDAGISFFEYMVMAALSMEPDRSMQMSDIARLTSSSLSRLSHTVGRLETRGWLQRERIPGPGRRTRSILTDDGYAKVVQAAPGHVRHVRDLVIDALEPGQLAVLSAAGRRVTDQIEPGNDCPGVRR